MLWLDAISVAVVIRFIALFDPGYIHPDEFFQAPEVMAHAALGRNAMVPWEFSCELEGKMYRSIVPPAMSTGLAFKALQLFGLEGSGRALFLAPRLLIFAVSLHMDRIVHRMFGTRTFYLYRTSWVAAVLLTRPFSNTFETYALLVGLSLADQAHAVLLGLLFSVGVFCRITFPAFAAPVAVLALVQNELWVQRGLVKKNEDENVEVIRTRSRCAQWATAMAMIARMAAGFIAGATLHVLADSLYAASNPKCTDATVELGSFKLVLTPLNNLMYNLQRSNLEVHGLHPLYTHVAANMAMLFSPLWVMPFIFAKDPAGIRLSLILALKGSCILGLTVLSFAPHQEARFLMPLLLPVSVLLSDAVTQWRVLRHFWKLFNLAMGVFFGLVHQAGVTRAMLALGDGLLAQENVRCVATYATYMAPRYLLGDAGQTVAAFVDLGGADPAQVPAMLRNASCPSSDWLLLLPTPAVGDFSELGADTLVTSWWPHFSAERLAKSAEQMALELHRYTV